MIIELRCKICALGGGLRDGWAIVMGADDDIVEVRSLQEVIEERPGIREPILSDERSICDKAIAPAHLNRRLPHAFDEEEGGRAELQS